MTERPDWMDRVSIDIDDEYIEAAKSHLENELANEYLKKPKSKAAKLLNHTKDSYLSGDEARLVFTEKAKEIVVSMSLPIFGGLSYSSIGCTCMEESLVFDAPRCHHMYAAQTALLDVLKAKAENKIGKDWAGFFEKAKSWADDTSDKEVESERIKWLFRDTGDIGALLQKKSADGWTRGRILSWKEFFEKKSAWNNENDRLLSSYIRLVDSYSDQYKIDLGALLEVFEKEGGLYLENDRDTELQIVRTSFRLKVLELGDEVEVHGVFSSESSQSQRTVKIDSWGYYSYNSKNKNLYIENLDEKKLQIVSPFFEGPIRVPASEKERLISYLCGIEKKLLVELDADLISADSVKAETDMVLRLTPFKEKGMKVELLCSPSSTKNYFTPASGPESVLESSKDGSVFRLERDFYEEQTQAELIVESLSLASYPYKHPSSWIIASDEACLEFMSRVERCGETLGFRLEWPKNVSTSPYERSEDLLSQSLQVSVGEKTEWFSLDVEIEIDGTKINLKEILDAIKKKKSYIKLDSGKWSKITESFKAKLEAIRSIIEENEKDQLELQPNAMEALSEFLEKEEIQIKKASGEFWRQKKSLRI